VFDRISWPHDDYPKAVEEVPVDDLAEIPLLHEFQQQKQSYRFSNFRIKGKSVSSHENRCLYTAR
jgi:hypothetical protein